MGQARTRNGCSFLGRVQDYLDGRLSASRNARFEQHLAECPDCRRELEDMRRVRRVLAEAAGQPLAGLDKMRVAAGLFSEGRRAIRPSGMERWWVPVLAASVAVAVIAAIVLWPVGPDGPGSSGPAAGGLHFTGPAPPSEPRPEPRPAPERAMAGRVKVAFSHDARMQRHTRGDGGTEIVLDRGSCYALLAPPVPGRTLVHTPAGSVEATGTVFVVQVRDPGHTGVWLFDGSLRLDPRQGRPFTVRAPVAIWLQPHGLQTKQAHSASGATADELARIRRLLAARKLGRARRALDAYLARRPDDPRAAFLLADARRLAGMAREAVALYLRVAERHGTAHARLAEAALYQAGCLQREKLGRPAEALETFDKALRKHPRGLLRQEILFQVAACRLAVGKFEQAVDSFEIYLRTYPRGTKAEEARTLLQALREKGWR